MTLNNYADCSYLLVYCLRLLLLLLILSLWAANTISCFVPLTIKHSALTDFGAIVAEHLPSTEIHLSNHENCAAQKSRCVTRFS